MFRNILSFFATVLLAAPVCADTWAESLFQQRFKDFGDVPRGPVLVHAFPISNQTNQAVHISSVRVSCGCVSASVAQDRLAPGESSSIQAHMDTRRFTGHKSVTIFVQFDQPQWEEVRLTVQANGREDIQINPESLAFGRVKKGSSPSMSINLNVPGFAITDVETESNYIQAAVKEQQGNSGESAYQVTATIRNDAPAGKWYSDLWLKTNSPSVPKIRVPLTVEIEPALSLSSSAVALGRVQPGDQAERKVVLRGAKPFKIIRIEGADDRWTIEDTTKESKPVHILLIKLKDADAGDAAKKFRIFTDLDEDADIELTAQAQVASR
jgi:hypothetical protein